MTPSTKVQASKNPTPLPIPWNFSDFLIYTTPDGSVKVEALLYNETLWLNQDKMAQLFGVQQPAIAKHLKNIFESEELSKNSVHSILEYTANDGKTYKTQFYNLDAIIAVGYRVNSYQATKFRIRATNVLKEYIIKGFAMDDERLKNPGQPFGQDYFEEQLARIRTIRASERRFYQKITDLYAQCSIDYDPQASQTVQFFATVQNKLHFAITGKTAAELIYQRVNAKTKHMGLTSRKYSPDWPIRKGDIVVAKNYLNKNELEELERIVEMYLNYAEDQARKRKALTMNDWIIKLNSFLSFNERDILETSGKISAELAQEKANVEFEKYQIIQDQNFLSDFDEFVNSLQSSPLSL